MKVKILPDTDSFLGHLESDIKNAGNKVLIQAMSFEGDDAGRWLYDRLCSSKAADRRICIDSYSKAVISDKMIYAPGAWFNRKLHEERRSTKRLIRSFPDHGVGVRFTNPLGLLLWRYPMRNHKKLFIIDDGICYIGGYNFSDHNFQWRDMALRFESREINVFFTDDFDATWHGTNRTASLDVDGNRFLTSNGRKGIDAFDEVLKLVAGARKNVVVFSPYITNPVLEKLVREKKKDVPLTVISPVGNNKEQFRDYLLRMSHKIDFKVDLYQANMSHLKAILIDDSILVTGTSNYDFVSYYLEQEIFTVITDEKIVADFKRLVLDCDSRESVGYDGSLNTFRAKMHKGATDFGIGYCRFLSLFKRK